MDQNIRVIRNLDAIMDGAVNERFEREWEKVIANCFDPNTDPEKTRSVIIKIDVKPNEDRTNGIFSCTVSSKIAPPVTVKKPLYLAVDDDGCVCAAEVSNVVPGQMDMEGNVHETKKTKIFEGNDSQKIIQFK